MTFTDSEQQITQYIVINLTNHLRIQLIINNVFYKFNESLKDLFRQRLYKLISNHFLTEYKVYLNLILLMCIIDIIIEDINVF